MKILVVEDDPQMVSFLRKCLGMEGYAVETTDKGLDAIDLIKSESYDLIILDKGLPDINGNQVCEAIRHANIEVPVLMLTGRDSAQDKISGLRSGADDYLIKPFPLMELLSRVDALLKP